MSLLTINKIVAQSRHIQAMQKVMKRPSLLLQEATKQETD